MEKQTKLILFDIDGTLMRTAGIGRESMELAFLKIFGIRNGFDKIQMMGRTDPAILKEALANNNISWSDKLVSRFKESYCDYFIESIQIPRQGKHLCPGILDLLEALRENPNFIVGLLTGNWQETAEIKLEYFGIDHFFQVGAFADDSETRDELLPFALRRATEKTGVEIHPSQAWIVGDTPLDVQCAEPHGALTLAVATGFHSKEDLEKTNPDFVFENLENTKEILKIFSSK